MRLKRGLMAALITIAMTAVPARADNNMREFIMSCTYGVLAGTLVGAAMLAFTNQPGEHLNKVARGASIGLYAGIILGVYVVYGVDEKEPEPELLNGPSEGWRDRRIATRWALLPTLHNQRPDGAGITGTVYSF